MPDTKEQRAGKELRARMKARGYYRTDEYRAKNRAKREKARANYKKRARSEAQLAAERRYAIRRVQMQQALSDAQKENNREAHRIRAAARRQDPEKRKRDKEKKYRYNKRWPERVRASQQRRHNRQRAIKLYKSPSAVDRLHLLAKKALPPGLARCTRDDVISEITLAIFLGTLVEKDLGKRAGEFLRAYNREYDTFKTLSLDAPMGGTDLRRIDLLEAPAPYEPDEDEEDPDIAILKGGYSRWQ
jgi:hypothetical protein